jgi:NAD(P)-dependent dehydrogenase (short-subunit alcohol dehydrogenase family)
MLLKDKTAIVYGAGGQVGRAVARVFAREGAHVVLAARRLDGLEDLAGEIGAATVARVDALDREQVERHAAEVVESTGRLDISINAVSIGGHLQGRCLLDMPVDDFVTPVRLAMTANFLTATAAARHMVERGSGAILTLSTSAAHLSGRDQKFHATGGFSVACGAVETFTRSLAAEVGPRGVRVVCLRPDAIPETWPDIEGEAGRVKTYMEDGTVLGRLPRLDEVAETAAFLASDRASAITGAVANLSCGSVLD